MFSRLKEFPVKLPFMVKIILLILISTVINLSAQPLDMELFQGIKARSIGPAGMSGRVTAVDVVLKNPDIIYIGTASGGVWRSKSGGIHWEPIFDDQPLMAIGAVAIDQRIPDIIWVGTGEGNPRNSQSSGDGIYKSLDGGRTWQHLGLEKTRNIHRIIIHPFDSDIVYVAAQGSAWGENAERGIYKTTDGGKTWQQILFVNPKTGAADLVMDPSNPNKLFAAMWEYRRWPWFFKSGGPGSGLYVTYDGGKNWKRLDQSNGLPEGDLGRIGIAVARSRPNIVYALIESKKNALYRSEDGGLNWEKRADQNIGNRPFYYAEIYADPQNENRLYNLFTIVTVSEDGGKTFQPLIPWQKIHPDHHAWWIHPDNPDYIIDGNDGGMAISRDRGKTWRFVENLPLAQFYHINIDNEIPYNIYGGMQDNGSWRGPGRVYRHGGIRNSYWEEISFGDGFDVVPDSSDARYGYSMSQGGNLYRYDALTGQNKLIQPVHPQSEKLRFNWNAGIAHDPFDKQTIYYGSQYLHKSTNRGDSWTIISPDLTTNEPEKQKQIESGGLTYDVTTAENFTTILSITPSTIQKDLIWVGTDDGNLHLTRDGGKTWNNVYKNIKGAPAGAWIPQIHASVFDAGEAFVVINNYRHDDWTPYVFHTRDYGKTWKSVINQQQVYAYALSFVQDAVVPNLYFLGTESGLYFSIDAGKNWTKWHAGYPSVSTMDMKIHPREHDLIIGTFGRSAYVLDNIEPLRQLARQGTSLLRKPLYLFPIPDAEIAVFKQPAGGRFVGEGHYGGENKPRGAMLTFILNPQTSAEKTDPSKAAELNNTLNDSVKIEILDQEKNVIRTLLKSPRKGFNRIYWGLEEKGVRFPNTPKPAQDAPEPGGPLVLPGTYLVRVSHGTFRDSTSVRVTFDHRIPVNMSDMLARRQLLKPLLQKIELATEMVDALNESSRTIEIIISKTDVNKNPEFKSLWDSGKALQDSIKKLIHLINQEEVQGIRSDPEKVGARLSRAYQDVVGAVDAPGQREAVHIRLAEEALQNTVEKINRFFATDWKAFQDKVSAARIGLFEEVKLFQYPQN